MNKVVLFAIIGAVLLLAGIGTAVAVFIAQQKKKKRKASKKKKEAEAAAAAEEERLRQEAAKKQAESKAPASSPSTAEKPAEEKKPEQPTVDTAWYILAGEYRSADETIILAPTGITRSAIVYTIIEGLTLETKQGEVVKVLYLVTNGVKRFYEIIDYALNRRKGQNWILVSDLVLTEDKTINPDIASQIEIPPTAYFKQEVD